MKISDDDRKLIDAIFERGEPLQARTPEEDACRGAILGRVRRSVWPSQVPPLEWASQL
jgi:hypothetical protein